jgi:uncharacterized membrane protein (UPF0136 family)
MNTDLSEKNTVELTQTIEWSKKASIFNFVYGAIVILGGVMGYIKAKSVPSLAAGMTFGNLLMLTVWGGNLFYSPDGLPAKSTSASTPKFWGHVAAVVLCVVLAIFFVIRLIKTGKPMPALPIISLAAVGVVLNSLVLHKKSLLKTVQ